MHRATQIQKVIDLQFFLTIDMEYDKKTGLYIEPNSGLYFDPKTKLYHNLDKDLAIIYDAVALSYFPLETPSSKLLEQQKILINKQKRELKKARKRGLFFLLI